MNTIANFFSNDKTVLAAINASWLTILLKFIEQYIFADWQILGTVLSLVAIDTVLGLWKHVKYKTVSSKGWGRLGEKIVIYFLLIVAGYLSNHTPDDNINKVTDWFYLGINAFIIVRELISITENAAAIRPGIVPSWITKRLKQFDKDGKFISNNDAEKKL